MTPDKHISIYLTNDGIVLMYHLVAMHWSIGQDMNICLYMVPCILNFTSLWPKNGQHWRLYTQIYFFITKNSSNYFILHTSKWSDYGNIGKKKTWNTSKGGVKWSAYGNIGRDKLNGPNNSDGNTYHRHTNWIRTLNLVPSHHSCWYRHREDTTVQGFNASKWKNNRTNEKCTIKRIWTTHRRISMKITERNKHYSFCCTQQYTSGIHSHILMNCSKCATKEKRTNLSMAHCRGKYNWIPGESNDKDGRSHNIKNTHQCRKFHTRRKISWMGHWKLLIRNTDGTVGIYYNKYQVNYARHYWKLQLKRPSQSRCMDSHGNNIRNVWTTTSGNYYKQLTYTTFKQPWILPGKKTPGSLLAI